MKNFLLAFALLFVFTLGTHVTFAVGAAAPAATTPTATPAATPAPAATPNTADGTVPPGGSCTNDNNCADQGSQQYGCDPQGQCTPNGVVPGPNAAGTQAAPTGASTGGTGNFVALTNLPVLQNLTTAPSLSQFFNQLYKYCVGIAAVLAMIQIMRAGLLYMGGDSVTETSEARRLIATSILGLVLVLSPVIVFQIINPNILSLNVGFSGLIPATQTSAPAASTPAATTPAPAATPAPTSPSNPPPSTIPSTGAVNPACHSMPDGTTINSSGGSQENSDEQCCANQSNAHLQCAANWDYSNISSPREYCSCTAH